MQSNCILGLAAVGLSFGLGFGVASASAATIDRDKVANSAPPSSVQPAQNLGNFGAGFSAIKSKQSKGLKGSASQAANAGSAGTSGLVRPDVGQGWRDGLAALSAGNPSGVVTEAGSQQAVMAPQGMAPNTAGLSALKGGGGEHGAAFIELPTEGYSGHVGIQRPEGSNWSDRGREGLRSDALGTIPGNLLGPSSK